MDARTSSSRLVTSLAVTAVTLAAMASAASAWLGRDAGVQRPAADAPVEVVRVKAPRESAFDRLPGVCATCTMGAPGRQL